MPRYIDADALPKELTVFGIKNPNVARQFGMGERIPSYVQGFNDCLTKISNLPTITPDEVRGVGEWIKAHDDVCWWWECSECHEQPLQRYKYDRLSNYCPSCGARMKGVSEDA